MEHAVGHHDEGIHIPPFVIAFALVIAVVIELLAVGWLGYQMLLPTRPFSY
jgi:hypothetical protein